MLDFLINNWQLLVAILFVVWGLYEVTHPVECTDPLCCPREPFTNCSAEESRGSGALIKREYAGFSFVEDHRLPGGTIMGFDMARPGSDRTVVIDPKDRNRVVLNARQMGKRQQMYKDLKAYLDSGQIICIDEATEIPRNVWETVAEKALSEQGASPQYIEKVKAELCGPFGRVMP